MKIIIIVLLITLGSCSSSRGAKCPAYGYKNNQKNNLS